MRIAYAVSLLLMCSTFGCISQRVPCTSRTRLAAAAEARRATLGDVKPRYLSIVEMDTVPAGARGGVEAWVDQEIGRVRAKAQPNDELWYFREEKCSGCGWYRAGYALIRGCVIVDEITLSDDM